ncbi:MAG: orotate phosphoribosyltransferase [Firmicutes bacterium]|nr:orotate phosphoribosyltransferase [Bacillota bacterium]
MKLSTEEIKKIFIESGALLEGHFRLTSGRHSDRYIQCARVLMEPKYTSALCGHLAEAFKNEKVDLVVGPAMGGIVISYEMAKQLGVPSLFTERVDGKMTLRRNFTIEPGQRVLVVEDVVTTGGSVKEVIDIVKENDGIVVGVALLVDRSNGKVDLGARVEACLSMDVKSYEADDCPLCKAGLPIVKPGSRSN